MSGRSGRKTNPDKSLDLTEICNLNCIVTCRSEELEELKRKMNAKLLDMEQQFEAAQARASQLEKTKTRLQGELEDTMVEVDRVSSTSYPNNKHLMMYF